MVPRTPVSHARSLSPPSSRRPTNIRCSLARHTKKVKVRGRKEDRTGPETATHNGITPTPTRPPARNRPWILRLIEGMVAEARRTDNSWQKSDTKTPGPANDISDLFFLRLGTAVVVQRTEGTMAP